MTDRQLEECLRLLSEVQGLIRGQNRPYNRLSKVRSILIRERRRRLKK